MLFWPKLLAVAHAIASSVRPYLPLYLSHFLAFSCVDIGILLAVPLGLRAISIGMWAILVVDQRPLLHGFFMALLTAVGTVSLVLILWIPPHAVYAWSAALCCMILDGIFYQPLAVLIDSAIIKILGDYKLLYFDAQRRWGDVAAAVMTVIIGWSLDDDHDFDTLMGTILLGAVILFLVSLSTNVQPVSPRDLGIHPSSDNLLNEDDLDEVQPIKSSCQEVSQHFYKPYCLFNEQLSHISEEDASMLQRISSTTTVWPSTNTTTAAAAAAAVTAIVVTAHNQLPTPESVQSATPFYELLVELPSCQLAILPTPPLEAPMLGLALLLQKTSNRFSSSSSSSSSSSINTRGAEYDDFFTGFTSTSTTIDGTSYALLVMVFLTGMASAMMNTLLYVYLHDGLGLQMHVIGMVGLMSVIAKTLAKPLVVHHVMGKCHFSVTLIHISLIMCAFCYTQLTPDSPVLVGLASIVLQFIQVLSFQSLWFVALQQLDRRMMIHQYRWMILRSKISAMSHSIGPALGALIAGFLVDRDSIILGFASAYRGAVIVLIISFIVSRGWSPDIED